MRAGPAISRGRLRFRPFTTLQQSAMARHATAPTDDLRDERLVVAVIVAAVVTALTVAQAAFFGGPSAGSPALHLVQGPAVACYALVLSVCVDPKRGLVPGALFVVIGASQPAWLLGVLMGLSALGLHRSAIPDPLWQAMPFLLSGLVFTPIVWLAVRAWWGPTLMLTATAAATHITGWGPRTFLNAPSEALGIAALHLGLCWTLTAAAIANTWRIMPSKPAHCPNCGYPREGLRTNVCPECGQRLP
jgi:hypothetical protein